MKKYIAVLLCMVLMLALILSSCGDEELEGTGSSVQNSAGASSTGTSSSTDTNASDKTDTSSSTDASDKTDTSSSTDASDKTDTSNGTENDDNSDNKPNTSDKIVLEANKTNVNVGDKITVKVVFNSLDGVKTAGFRPIFDEEFFELVSGKMLMTGEISNFSDGIGVIAFDETVDINGQVMQFILKAKKSISSEAIGCEVSVKGAEDKTIVVSQPADVIVEVE